jgi:hypothetical protein
LDEPVDAAERSRAATQAISVLRGTMEEDAGVAVSGTALLGPELRPVVLGAHIGTEVEGIADVGVQLVELARLRRGRPPLPARLRAPLQGMASGVLVLVAAAGEVLEPSVPPRPTTTDADAVAREQHTLHDRLLTGEQPLDSADAGDAVLLACRLVQAAHHAESVIAHAHRLTGTSRAH